MAGTRDKPRYSERRRLRAQRRNRVEAPVAPVQAPVEIVVELPEQPAMVVKALPVVAAPRRLPKARRQDKWRRRLERRARQRKRLKSIDMRWRVALV